MILTPYEKQKLAFAQEQVENKMYRWGLTFITLYFVLRIGGDIINLI